MSKSPVKKNKLILVVDDDVILRKLLKFFLRHDGYAVLAAENGAAGCEIIKKEQIDLIILDAMMPVMDGFNFLQWLRVEQDLKTPVLSLTGMETETSKQLLLDAGADKVLFKPIKNHILKQNIELLLDQAEHKI
ncbi:MAG: response regulator [Gammaproteobacteria bacterium]|nr:response regulator [Gammaproteobacteria bacterium]